MNSQSKKMELLGSTSIPKALLAMGIPTMIGMLVNAFYNLVDAYFVGGLGESQMGAISVVYPLGQVVVGLGLLFGNGAASYISRLLGRGDKENADKVASTALYSSVSVGAVIIIISMVFLHPILKLLGATDSILPFAATYARLYIVSCIFNVFNVTMNNIVTSEGAAKTTMCIICTLSHSSLSMRGVWAFSIYVRISFAVGIRILLLKPKRVDLKFSVTPIYATFSRINATVVDSQLYGFSDTIGAANPFEALYADGVNTLSPQSVSAMAEIPFPCIQSENILRTTAAASSSTSQRVLSSGFRKYP